LHNLHIKGDSFTVVVGKKSLDFINDRQSRDIQRQMYYSYIDSFHVKTPFLVSINYKDEEQYDLFSVFMPFILEEFATYSIERTDDTHLFGQDTCSNLDLFSFYSKDSKQIITIPIEVLQQYSFTPKEIETEEKDTKLDYLYDILSDIKAISEVTNNVITESSDFLEDFVEEVEDVNVGLKKNTRKIEKLL